MRKEKNVESALEAVTQLQARLTEISKQRAALETQDAAIKNEYEAKRAPLMAQATQLDELYQETTALIADMIVLRPRTARQVKKVVRAKLPAAQPPQQKEPGAAGVTAAVLAFIESKAPNAVSIAEMLQQLPQFSTSSLRSLPYTLADKKVIRKVGRGKFAALKSKPANNGNGTLPTPPLPVGFTKAD